MSASTGSVDTASIGEFDPPPKIDLCEACGKYHGSVGEAFACLKNEIRQQRRYIHTLRGMLAKATGQDRIG